MPTMTFLDNLEMFHKGKAKAQPEMMPIEILRETGMSYQTTG
jgi:hypothetical protein